MGESGPGPERVALAGGAWSPACGRAGALSICITVRSFLQELFGKGKPCCTSLSGCRPLVCEQDADRIQELFGFSEEEEVMECFEVKLRQTLSCTHNTFSKPQEVEESMSLLPATHSEQIVSL